MKPICAIQWIKPVFIVDHDFMGHSVFTSIL